MNRLPAIINGLDRLLEQVADTAADQLVRELHQNVPASLDPDRTIARSVYRRSRRRSDYATAASNLPPEVRLTEEPLPDTPQAAVVAFAHRDAIAAAYGSGETQMGSAAGWFDRTLVGFRPRLEGLEQQLDKEAR